MKIKKPACHNCKHSRYWEYRFLCKKYIYKQITGFDYCDDYTTIYKDKNIENNDKK